MLTGRVKTIAVLALGAVVGYLAATGNLNPISTADAKCRRGKRLPPSS
jgi:hypothetical protein